MKKITHVEVRIERGGNIKEKRISEYGVLAENESHLVINDRTFTSLQWEKEKYNSYSVPEHVSISLNNKDEMWEKLFGFITIRVYSFKTIKQIEKQINKEFNAFIEKQLGFYGSMRGIEIVLI